MIHTVSLEIAKQLKKAGWDIETENIWTSDKIHTVRVVPWVTKKREEKWAVIKEYEQCPAPTCGELLRELLGKREFLEGEEDTGWNCLFLELRKEYSPEKYIASYDAYEFCDPITREANAPEDALALLWIKLNS